MRLVLLFSLQNTDVCDIINKTVLRGVFMKKALQIIGCVFCLLDVVILIFAIATGYITYPLSFARSKCHSTFEIHNNADSMKDFLASKMTIKEPWFNYYGIRYNADCHFKGTITYKSGVKEYSEDFFLEPGENMEFYSFIDEFLGKRKANELCDIKFQPLDKGERNINILGISTFNRKIPENEVYIESQNLKLGVDLLWGGALSYLEDLDSNVEAVVVDGKIEVDSNASKRYNTEAVNTNVNLINRNDTGRLVQQSYYGTLEYDFAKYNDNDWRYNPVQGGNQYNDASKIVDLRITEDSIYVKCRPLDWAKEKEYITPSYMEATYTFENGLVHASCRFVDFSGYPSATATQEIPAFYCVEPLGRFVYYGGKKPWTNDKLTIKDDLIFWPDANYPTFESSEHWAAFTGMFEDSFGIGLYVPEQTKFLSGIYAKGETTNEDPSRDGPTSYIAVVKDMEFKSFAPFSYEFYLATGSAEEIRGRFEAVDK